MARPLDKITPRLISLTPRPAKGEVLFLHGAWRGSWCFQDLAEPVYRAGWEVHILELPGHGFPLWELPGTTSIRDYAAVAQRAAAGLRRPVLVGHSLGGWLAMKILEVVDLPAVLLAPLPAGGVPLTGLWRFVRKYPKEVLGVCLGKSIKAREQLDDEPQVPPHCVLAQRVVPEPARVCLEMGLGLARARPRPGREPRLILAGGRDRLLPAGALRRLAHRLGAQLEILPGHTHNLWLRRDHDHDQVVRHLLAFLDRLAPAAVREKAKAP